MKLAELIDNCVILDVTGDVSVEIDGITSDSRKAGKGCLFVAVSGGENDGHDFVDDAVRGGAGAIILERASSRADGITTVLVPQSRKALGEVSARFYGDPSRRMKLAGITGTNGKTTITYLLEAIVGAGGLSPGVIGTVNYRYAGHTLPATNTTPGPEELQRLMAGMADSGVTHCIMEVSSHALDQERVSGCSFDTVIFTNLTRDHLDYHGTMDDYGRAKERLFLEVCGEDKKSVINIDDPFGLQLAGKEKNAVTYGIEDGAVRPVEVQEDRNGISGFLESPWGRITFDSPLIGRYNLYNIMAAAAGALSMGVEKGAVEEGIRGLKRVPGRIDRVAIPESYSGCRVFVDYAHTPDALERVIMALRPTTEGRLITIFGCGGNRDREKRPLMGGVSILGSDFTIITSDNPRDEEPPSIIEDIVNGIKASGGREGEDYCIIPDRKAAIRSAAGIMERGDTLLIAGKGHEDYQILGGERIHFDDREEAERAFEMAAGRSKVA